MKKIFLPLLLVIFLSSPVCAAAVSEDMSVYVRKEVFEVEMKNINSRLDNISSELKVRGQEINELSKSVAVLSQKVDDLSKRIDDNFAILSQRMDDMSKHTDDVEKSLSKRIDDNFAVLSQNMANIYSNLDARISDLRNGMYLMLVLFGIVITMPAVKKFFQWNAERKTQSSFATIEDIRRLIEENNMRIGVNLK